MKVNLIRYIPDTQKLAASSAKLCYSNNFVMEIEEGLTDKNIENFIDRLMGLGHMFPVERISFTFTMEGVSRTLTHQLVRHGLVSYSQRSQRYMGANNYEYITPPKTKNSPKALEIYGKHMKHTIDAYNELTEILIQEEYDRLIESGVDEKKAKSMLERGSIEDTRYVFSNTIGTEIVMTMNARELLCFFGARCCQRAQWGIREMTTLILTEVKKVCPQIFGKVGPGCVKGGCPKGRVTCGKIKQVREHFNSLD